MLKPGVVKKREAPRPGIEPGSPAWQAGILTTILTRNCDTYNQQYRIHPNKTLLQHTTPHTTTQYTNQTIAAYKQQLHTYTRCYNHHKNTWTITLHRRCMYTTAPISTSITSSTSSPDKYLYRYTIRYVHAWWISTLLFVDRGVSRMNNIISQRRVHFETIHT